MTDIGTTLPADCATPSELLALWRSCTPSWVDEVEELAEHLGVSPGALVRGQVEPGRPRPSQLPPGSVDLAAELRALRVQVEALARTSASPVLVSVAQAAEVLGVSEKTVRRAVADGSLPSRRVGRSVRVDLAGVRGLDREEVAQLARDARNGTG